MKLILTRHGETVENSKRIIQGHLPGKLSEKGIDQAKKLADRLKTDQIDFIYSSDLARAADTAKEIAKHHKVPIKFTKELRERNLGEFEGKTKKELNLLEDKEWPDPENGETSEELYKRAEKFVHKLLHKHKNNTVLCVAHNGINRAITAVITNKKTRDIECFSNTSITVFEIDEEKNHKIHLFNCTKHT